jgi:hypothetical protein
VNIRSITGLVSLVDPLPTTALAPLRDLVDAARQEFARLDLPIETARVATQPLSSLAPHDLTRFARDLEAAGRASGIEFASLGALPGDHPLAQAIPAALAATENVFASTLIASRADGIHLRSVYSTARIIRAIADQMTDGFGNFRFAALANCGPHSPFFPAAYHDGGAPAFALAPEGAALAVQVLNDARDREAGRADLVRAIDDAAQTMVRVANGLAARFAFRFAGIDFSLAPSPEETASIGTAIERLIGAPFGDHGTLFAAAFLTDCIRRADFPRVGFSGLMLPVLEDATLAARSSNYTLDSLLLYSTVCGTGLDTIPLPGDTTADALAAILLDLATLSVKLDKPLTARLIPLAGLEVGETTRFNYKYFANAHVLDPHARALKVFDSDTRIRFDEGR